jgi:predicted RNA-binding Zn-ribbon protein involved in translation (DUF1610 family)
MHYVVGALVTGALALIVLLFGGCFQPAQGTEGGGDPDEGTGDKRESQRQRLAQRLKALAASPAPTELAMGAMCYAVMPASPVADYVCPDCGEKTQYADGPGRWALGEVEACRRLVEEIDELDVSLDESELCASCGGAEKPQLILEIHYEDEDTPRRVRGVTEGDLQLLREFLDGEKVHTDSQDFESPLKDYTDRLAEILGTRQVTRANLQARLAELAQTEPPTELAPGAMCYEIAMPPERAEYICPTCGERTLYGQELAGLIEWDLESCRRRAEAIEGMDVTLDESELCRSCSPETEEPTLAILIHYAGEPEPLRIDPVQPADLKLISEFLGGSLVHEGETGFETPLVDHMDRLAEVLGLDAPAETVVEEGA